MYDNLRAEYFRRQHPHIGDVAQFVDDQRTQHLIDEPLRPENASLKRDEHSAKTMRDMRNALGSGEIMHDILKENPDIAMRIPDQIARIEKRAAEEGVKARADIYAREATHVESIAADARDRADAVQAGILRGRGTERATAETEPTYEGGYGPVSSIAREPRGTRRVASRDRGAIDAGRIRWRRPSTLPGAPGVARIIRDPVRFAGGVGAVGGQTGAEWRAPVVLGETKLPAPAAPPQRERPQYVAGSGEIGGTGPIISGLVPGTASIPAGVDPRGVTLAPSGPQIVGGEPVPLRTPVPLSAALPVSPRRKRVRFELRQPQPTSPKRRLAPAPVPTASSGVVGGITPRPLPDLQRGFDTLNRALQVDKRALYAKQRTEIDVAFQRMPILHQAWSRNRGPVWQHLDPLQQRPGYPGFSVRHSD